jgi:hypothetical protein
MQVIEWNDVKALEEALAPGDVATVLAEPVMANIGIIHPDPSYHSKLREITCRQAIGSMDLMGDVDVDDQFDKKSTSTCMCMVLRDGKRKGALTEKT